MRKSYIVSLTIVLLAFVGMMMAADMALKPMKRTMAIGSDLTGMLEARGDLEPETKVLVIARKAEARHLAKGGFGLIVEFEPSEGVRRGKGRLERVAQRVVREAGRLYESGRGKPVDWYEIRFMDGESAWHRSLFRVDKDGRTMRPEPAIPALGPATAP